MKKGIQLIFILSLFTFLSACGPSGSEPINFGKDQCHYCRMTILNPKFGAELITKKGRVYKYDAAECVVNQLEEENIDYAGIFAIAYDKPQELKPVDSLHFVISPDFRSPMGANLAAFADETQLSEKHRENTMSWEELRKKMNQ